MTWIFFDEIDYKFVPKRHLQIKQYQFLIMNLGCTYLIKIIINIKIQKRYLYKDRIFLLSKNGKRLYFQQALKSWLQNCKKICFRFSKEKSSFKGEQVSIWPLFTVPEIQYKEILSFFCYFDGFSETIIAQKG